MADPLSLVTGACGFMGTHMIDVLREAGHRIRATDLPGAFERDDRGRGVYPTVVREAGAEIVPLDLTAGEDLAKLVDGVDYVFHIAAVFSYSAPWKALEAVNVGATERLIEAVLARKKKLRRLVLWGAGGVYGYPKPGGIIRETDPADPCNDYLRSKHLQEQAVARAGGRGLPFTIMRPTGVYGPRQVYGGADLTLGMAKMKLIALPRNFTQPIPFVHVRDVCRAALHLADRKEAAGEAYNLSDGVIISTVEHARHVAQIMNRRFLLLPPVPVRALRAGLVQVARASQAVARRLKRKSPIEADTISYLGHSFVYANDKLLSTGFRFEFPDPREGVRQTLAWYAREGWIDEAPRGAPRHRYETLARAPDDELERVFFGGARPPEDALCGWEFRGWNTLPATQLGGFRKFKKGFYRDAEGLAGYNVAIRNSALPAPWQPRLRGGKIVHHGFYRVVPPDARHPNALLIDYGLGKNPTLDPSRVLRDYLVQPYADDPDLLLGKAYVAVGSMRRFVSYFVLARDGKTTYPA